MPAITENAVDLVELLPLIVADPAAAGEEYGHQSGTTSPFAYPVSAPASRARSAGPCCR